jgi:hypothetical protein
MGRKPKSKHSTICAKPNCYQCCLLRDKDEELHPSEVPTRKPFVWEGAEELLAEQYGNQ